MLWPPPISVLQNDNKNTHKMIQNPHKNHTQTQYLCLQNGVRADLAAHDAEKVTALDHTKNENVVQDLEMREKRDN